MQDDAAAGDDDPTEHFVHSVAVVVLVNFPAKHDVQIDPAAMYCPIVQDVHEDPPAGADDPIGHFVHAVAVVMSVYVPAEHFSQADPPGGL